jgi:hypothetical protein
MKKILLTSAALLMLAAAANAQNGTPVGEGKPTMTLTGAVYDTNGAVIVNGLKIVLRGVVGAPYETSTNEEGIYKIKLPLGVYRIRVSAPGFCPAMVEKYRVVNSTYGKMNLDFVLEVHEPGESCDRKDTNGEPGVKKDGKQKIEIIME